MRMNYLETPSINIDGETCSKCGMCARICPVSVFDYVRSSIPKTRYHQECVMCGQCLCACPTGSIQHSGFNMANFQPIPAHRAFDATDAFQFLSQRRSMRNYKSEIPSKELLEELINIAGFAPGSPHHRVGWVRNATVVMGHEPMKKVTAITADYMEQLIKLLSSWYMNLVARYSDRAKAGVAVVPSFKTALKAWRSGDDKITYNAPAAIFLHAPENSSMPQSDCDAAALMIQLYAEARGLGTCWNGLIQGAAAGDHLKGFNSLARFLNIPKGHRCYAAMTIGYPSIRLHSLPERRTEIDWIG